MDSQTTNSSKTVVIGSQYCAPVPQQFIFPKKLKAPGVKRNSRCTIDTEGKLIFKTDAPILSAKHKTVLIDATTENALVSIQKKIMNPHGIWEVYTGRSYDPKDLLFTVERTSALQIKTELNVFLASNITKEIPDFAIDGDYNKQTCKVYKGLSSTIVAQMSNERELGGMRLKKRDFILWIEPNVDTAFVAALMAIRHRFYMESKMMMLTLVTSGGIATLPSLALTRMM